VIERIHYTIQEDRNLPKILFLHGFLGSYEDFDPVISRLCHQFCCLSIDLPGHGKTQVMDVDRYTMPNTAQAIIQLLDRLEIPQSHLIGYSMGGRLALYLALYFPDRFPKVILESASPGLKTEAEQIARKQHDAELADRLESDFPKFLMEWYEQPLFRSLKQHPNFEQIVKQRLQNCSSELAKSLRYLGIGEQPSLWDKLIAHQHPLLLLVGERDRKFISINEEMASLCRMAQLEIVPDAGHNIHLENPEKFVTQIQKFLRNS
jgi:2-succinyl-6-hydroxy-2,4-cyclohexadiene-1-carboxylate synthase